MSTKIKKDLCGKIVKKFQEGFMLKKCVQISVRIRAEKFPLFPGRIYVTNFSKDSCQILTSFRCAQSVRIHAENVCTDLSRDLWRMLTSFRCANIQYGCFWIFVDNLYLRKFLSEKFYFHFLSIWKFWICLFSFSFV